MGDPVVRSVAESISCSRDVDLDVCWHPGVREGEPAARGLSNLLLTTGTISKLLGRTDSRAYSTMDSIARVLAELYRCDTTRSCVVTAKDFRLAVEAAGLRFDDALVHENIM